MSQQIYRKKSAKKAERFPIAFGSGQYVKTASIRQSFLFNNGSTLEFNSQKEKMIAKFKAEDVYEHVQFPVGAVLADIHETQFLLPEPQQVQMVDGSIAVQVLAQNALQAVIHAASLAAPGYNVEMRGRLLHEIAMDHNRKVLALQQTRPALMARYEDAHKTWVAERTKFEKKKAGCMKVFHEIFGPTTLATLQPSLSISHYRTAWFTVCQHNAQVNLGQANMNQMLNQLTNVHFNAAHTTLADLEADLGNIYLSLLQIDVPTPDTMKLHHLVNALAKSPGQEFKHVIDHVQLLNVAYPQAREMFYVKDAQLRVASDFTRSNDAIEARLKVVQAVKKKVCNHCKRKGHPTEKCWYKAPCSVCNKTGHSDGFCVKGKGPATKSGTTTNSTTVNDRFNNQTSDYSSSSVLNTIHPDYILHDSKITDDIYVDNSCTATVERTKLLGIIPGNVSDQLIFRVTVVLASLISKHKSLLWRIILDSGASSHMLPYSMMLINTRSAQGEVIMGDENSRLPIEGMGDTNISYISDVLYVPDLTVGVISVSAFDKKQCTTVFSDGVGIVYDCDGSIILTSTQASNGLYEVDALYIDYLCGVSSKLLHYTESSPQSCQTSSYEHCNCTMKRYERVERTLTGESEVLQGVTNNYPTVEVGCMCRHRLMHVRNNIDCRGQSDAKGTEILINHARCFTAQDSTVQLNPLEILHSEWGHLGEKNIKRALKDNIVKGCRYNYNDVKDLTMRVCFDCLQGRMKAKSSSPTTSHSWTPFEKIAVDFKGYFSKKGYHGERGFMLFVDYATNYVHAELVKSKSEHVRTLKDYKLKIIDKYGKTWKVLQTDSESIFKSQLVANWIRNHEIRLQLSTPYQHWQNGQVEVFVGIVMDKSRTLMCTYLTPAKYWGFAVLYACYVINRMPTSDHATSAYETLTGEKPDVSWMVPFYAPGVFHLTHEERKTPWSVKAEPCRMLGYADGYLNAYYVLNIRTQKVVVREHCIFSNNVSEDDVADVDIDESELRDDIDNLEDMIEQDPEFEESNNTDRVDDSDDDDVTSNESLFSAEYHDLHHLSTDWYADVIHQVHNTLALPPNPKSVDEALAGPDAAKWEAAIAKEVSQFKTRDTFGPAEQSGRGMKTKLILYYKYDGDYNIVCKARLVVCGYSQRKGIDYHETYSPTTTNPIVFLLLHLAGNKRMHTASFDVSAAYLEGKSDTRMYAWLPAELQSTRTKVRIEILGNWYGSKQAGKIWNDLFHTVVLKMNFIQCPVMPCLYIWVDGSDIIMLTVHVDDGLLVCSNLQLAEQFMSALLQHVRKAVLYNTVKLYLGMDITCTSDGSVYSVTQCRYIEKEFADYHHSVKTPMSVTSNLRIANPNTDNAPLLHDTGRFRYLADRTRPDILVAVGEVSTGGADAPSDDHVRVSHRIMNYLTCTKDACINLGGDGAVEMFAYCDASYITVGKCKSRLGSCIFMGYNAGAISSVSKNDTLVSHSSTEAEIKAIDMVCREIVYMRDVLKFLGYEQSNPTRIYVDSCSAIELCKILKVNHKARHINMRIHYIRELINARIIELVFVPTKFNVADVLTKALSYELHVRHIDILMHGHGGVDIEFMRRNKSYSMYMEEVNISDVMEEGEIIS